LKTFASFGTSAPEIVVDFTALLRGSPAIALGDALGSSLIDATLSIGIGPLIAPAEVTPSLALTGALYTLGAVAVVGALPRLAVLVNPGNFSHTVFLEETRTAAQATGSAVHAVEARTREELEPALAAARARADALIVFDDPVLWSHRAHVVDLAVRRRLPVMYGYREFVDEGGLMSYGPSRPDLYRRTAIYVDKILRGARPAELPVERPTRFELVVNLRAAAAIGVTMPPALLARADAIVQ